MGCCTSSSRLEFRVLMLGLDAAGKTDILYRSLMQKEGNYPRNTVGFNAELVMVNDAALAIWEVPGQETIRSLWMHYYADTKGMIFVIDSNDKERKEEIRDALYNIILSHPQISYYPNIPLLILCNKQDLPHAMSREEVCMFLDLFETPPAEEYYDATDTLPNHIIDTIFDYLFQIKSELNGRQIHLQECCGITGEGVAQGMQWFVRQLRKSRDFNQLNDRSRHSTHGNRNRVRISSVSKKNSLVEKENKKMRRMIRMSIEIQEKKEKFHQNMDPIQENNDENTDIIMYKKQSDAAHAMNKEPVVRRLEAPKSISPTLGAVPQTLSTASVLQKTDFFMELGQKEKVELKAVKKKKPKKKSRVAQMAMNYDSVDSID